MSSEEEISGRDVSFNYDAKRAKDEAKHSGAWEAFEAGEGPHPNAKPEEESIWDGKGRLRIHQAALVLYRQGPLACGPGDVYWTYSPTGVWQYGENIVDYRIGEMLHDSFSPGARNAIKEYLIRKVPEIEGGPHPELVNFRNVMYRWKTGEVLQQDEKYMSVCQLAVEYRPSDECPWFDKFVGEVNHGDAIEYFWQLFGYLLIQGNPKQRALFVHGSGSNGKGVWFRTIERIVGRANMSNVSLENLAKNPFAGAELQGKLLNLVGDIDPKYIESTAQFKQVTGGDTVRAERKFKDAFSFVPWCVPVFSGNLVPPSSDPSHGWKRRWMVIDFPNQFEQDTDPDLERRFGDELPAITIKAIRAYAMVKGDFILPPSAIALKQEFDEASDVVARFLRERTSPPTGGQVETEKGELFNAYEAWCGDERISYLLGRNKFYKRVEACGHQTRQRSVSDGGWRYFRGVRLNGLV